jgi:polyprenyl P-hydroxybenzoate/phenylacrylic acid decarboxylase-like protein
MKCEHPIMKLLRKIFAITRASVVVFGLRLLKALRKIEHCWSQAILSAAKGLTAMQEHNSSRSDIEQLVHVKHILHNIAASMTSGSFKTYGMLQAPCPMKALASIALDLSDNLVSHAADVVLKERQRFVLMMRETPLNLAQFRNTVAATEMGCLICPPVPVFFTRPATLDDFVNHSMARVLDLFALDRALTLQRWLGLNARAS